MGADATRTSKSNQSHPDTGLQIAPYRAQAWYFAYMDTLFESDRTRMAERIRSAEQLIVNRERELFSRRGDTSERQALANALHALRALRSCVGI